MTAADDREVTPAPIVLRQRPIEQALDYALSMPVSDASTGALRMLVEDAITEIIRLKTLLDSAELGLGVALDAPSTQPLTPQSDVQPVPPSVPTVETPKAVGGTHKPFTDDGVTYCGWDGNDGCGQIWPCATERAHREAAGATPDLMAALRASLEAAKAERLRDA